jgi:membrane associated rhomboid family serine protease
MIPLKDNAPSGSFPFVTFGIIIVNVMVFLYEISLGPALDSFILDYAVIPVKATEFYRFGGGFTHNALVPLVTSLFIHGGIMHIVGNMWFLWIFGDNIEDRLGHFRYLLFYLICGVGASFVQIFVDPGSRLPIIGASGAISGVLGAYLISFPNARILTLLFIILVYIPAFVFIIVWFLFQFFSGAAELGRHVSQDTGGVAYWAHIGGFVAGVALLFVFPKNPDRATPAWFDRRR